VGLGMLGLKIASYTGNMEATINKRFDVESLNL